MKSGKVEPHGDSAFQPASTVPPDLTLVLPAFNEERRLPRALEMLSDFAGIRRLKVELIVVDDGSTDATSDVVPRWIADHSSSCCRVRLLKAAHRGKGAAVRFGVTQATGSRVGYCDVDLSAGPDALAAVLCAIEDGADVAMASRGLGDSVLKVRQSWPRERAGRFFNLLLRRFSGLSYRDTQCGLKLFTNQAAKQIFRFQRIDGFAFDVEVLMLAERMGLQVSEVPVCWSHDPESKVSYIADALAMVRDTTRLVRRFRASEIHAPGIPHGEALDRMFKSESSHWWYAAKRALVAGALRKNRPGRCLDLGCGGGAMLIEASKSMNAFGVDLAVPALLHSRRRGIANLARSEASRLPFESGSFDAVLALDVVEHHPMPEELLAEARRVLDPQGVLIVTVPAYGWMWSYADNVLGHYRRYVKRQLAAELASAGFVAERVTYFHSWLLPIAWVFRRVRPLFGRPEKADDFELPPLLNRMFLRLSLLELRLLGRTDLPLGLSILAVARPAPHSAFRSLKAGTSSVADRLTAASSGR